MMSIAEVDTVKSFLISKHIFANRGWLEECVKHISHNIIKDIQQIKTITLEQWLLNDLKKVSSGCLPPNLKNEPKMLLTEKYMLQINSELDIGISAYQQYCKLTNVNDEDVQATLSAEEKIHSHRCVKHISHNIIKDIQQIKTITLEQWLLNDLKKVSSGCLPPNLKNEPKMLLTEKYMLQINSELDIGISAYQQYCKLTNVNDEDVQATLSAEEKIHSHRMLKLSLTDGVQDIFGIEYKSINKIKKTLIPGSKVLITGPVVCRSGVLFLDNSSIQVIGGEVEELSNHKTKTEILALKLGLSSVPSTSNNQPEQSRTEQPEKTEPLIDSHDRLGTQEPPEKRRRTFSNEPSSDLIPNVCKDHVKIVSSKPFIYIKQINDMSESAKMGKTCKVKAQILYLLKKPFYSKDSWMVECKITDGTGCLNVQIDSDWFSELVLYTPQMMAELNKKRLSNPAEIPKINRDLVQKLGQAMKILKSLYCIMELTILATPVIKKFIPFEKKHVDLINERLQGL